MAVLEAVRAASARLSGGGPLRRLNMAARAAGGTAYGPDALGALEC